MAKANKSKTYNVEFEQLKLDFDIITEKKYTEETGLELPKVESDEVVKKSSKQKNKVEKCDKPASVDIDKASDVIADIKEKVDESITGEDKTNNINECNTSEKLSSHEINIAPTVTKENEFIAAVNESNKIKQEREKEELSNIDVGYPYRGTQLMTNAEKQLFLFMENNLVMIDRIRIIPKVRLADIIQVEERLCKKKEALWKITSKHVDYIIVDKYTFDLICVVELDDYTHETPEAKERDEFVFYSLFSAGIHLHRVKCRIADISKKELRDMEESILMYYRKPCAMCGADTRVKSKTSGNKIGHRFYSCTNFPNCRHTIDID